jgi:7,8-dihydropterin-6-yl-methyl-4-(beta-D-ribofuranosyl)aminobenzene 5'-phosphate synthase
VDAPFPIRPADSVDVTLLVDNSIDLLVASDDHAQRPLLHPDWLERTQLRAEHGFSALITIRSGGDEKRLIYDAGLTAETLVNNLTSMGITLEDVQSIVLSHGHGDHHGGLEGLLRKVGRKRLPLILHPDAWKMRKIVFPTGAEINLPPPDRKMLSLANVEIVEQEGPSFQFGEEALVSGRVERVTEFEKGFPIQWAQGKSGWEPDPMIWDDQNLVCAVKEKGLVVVSGCGHAGAINILRNARRLTGIQQIHAFVGGVHLTGRIFEPIISPTVDELERLRPDYIVPGHCTGWKARQEISRRLPGAYLEPSVGTRYHFS